MKFRNGQEAAKKWAVEAFGQVFGRQARPLEHVRPGLFELMDTLLAAGQDPT